jgi:hypothetical protein
MTSKDDLEYAMRLALDDRLDRAPRPDAKALAKTLFKAAAAAPPSLRIAVLDERYEELRLDLQSVQAAGREEAAKNVLRDLAVCDAARRLLAQ